MVLFCLPCLTLLAYFIIAGIFFPQYRGYVKDGWGCFVDKLKGRKCSASFDNRMRLAFSMWLTKHRMSRLGKFFYSERNFKLTFTILGITFTILSIYLSIIFIQYLINPPCTDNVCAI